MLVFVFTRLELFRLPQADTKVKGKLFITRYQINFFLSDIIDGTMQLQMQCQWLFLQT